MKTIQQSNHWIDEVATRVAEWQTKQNISHLHVDDMKTPSGRVHTGALRGVVLHDLTAKTLNRKFESMVTSTYVFNDMDPMDGLPGYLPTEKFEKYMGVPLYLIPAPSLEESGVDFSLASEAEKKRYSDTKSFAEFYALDFIDAFRTLGCTQKIIWSHELYESGKMDSTIKIALDSTKKIKTIYKEVADYKLPSNWFPFQVTCPQCGKVGTTITTDWDGKEVTFECQQNKVTWAVGCGYKGSISPFGGTGKLLWKVDWPGHWAALGVTVEGAGKDHTSAGGSRDMANVICKEVFNIEAPFDIPYEWILIRGAKMSSSKGIGTSAREFVQLFPPTIGRFLFASKEYSQVIDFDPTSLSIPDLFDEYDQAARIFWEKEKGDKRLGRAFEISQIDQIPEEHFLPRFRDLALWMQHPEINLQDKFSEISGSPLSQLEKEELEIRRTFAEKWVKYYAPEDYQLKPKNELPPEASQLTVEQTTFLQEALDLIESKSWQATDLQQELFEVAKRGIGTRKAFQAIYLAFIGKKSGPRAAWFLLSIDPELRSRRIRELQNLDVSPSAETTLDADNLISSEVKQQFPGIFFATVKISGVYIQKEIPELQELTKKILRSLTVSSTSEIAALEPIQAYRSLFKATGTDFHSKRPSPEALLRRVVQGKDLYQINTAVDAYNLAVLETGVGLGGFDAKKISGKVRLRFSRQGEPMKLLSDSKPTLTRENQLVYADKEKAITIDLNYRDIDETKITTSTSDIQLFADGAPNLEEKVIIEALQKGAEYIHKFCGGTIGTVAVNK
ncbi:MAG: lysine--tRNA ligase [Candidatus Pacebacteria bacterium CG_4_10_14_0_8_um_filter_42_14]|nr:MAG: lysine--tRNA ligase [Candidatus Pacebacteria bacterium CG_4_10_14_0_8_um_filter_42_14]